ncbi:MAG: hypothetical protein MZW92_52250 [Comamonadaceae bacterium]|nr:hypothetical protein [Comamonadaceae bacterium]
MRQRTTACRRRRGRTPCGRRPSRAGDHQAAIGARRPTPGARRSDRPARRRRRERDNVIRVDTARLDQVLNLSGEIGLTKNRLNAAAQRHPRRPAHDTETLHALDLAVSQLDLLVVATCRTR